MIKAGFVGVVGITNAGKSTFLNRVLGEYLLITSPLPQTSRFNVKGIYNDEDSQIVFVDTPGFHKVGKVFEQCLLEEIKEVISEDLDLYLWIINGSEIEKEKELLEEFTTYLKGVKKIFLVINKVDLLSEEEREKVFSYAEELLQKIGAELGKVFFISALSGEGVEELIAEIKEILPQQSAPFYDSDDISDLPVRFFVEEFIREAVIEETYQEIPYSSFILIDDFIEKPHLVEIHATIFVERDGQKGIVIGKGGEKIKKIGIKAREKIENFLGQHVNLKLRVKVYKNWSKSEDFFKRTGLKKYVKLLTSQKKKKKRSK